MDNRLKDIQNGKGGNYLLPFLWMHGEDEALVMDELDKIAQCGIKSVCLESRTHEDFAGEGWWQICGAVLREAKKRGMTVWILDDKHFPTGYANGLLMQKYPQRRKWHLVEQHTDVVGPQNGAVLLEHAGEEHTADERTVVAAVAYRRQEGSDERLCGEPVVLTDRVKGPLLYWDVPEGCWRVFVLYQTREGAMHPDYIHMIDPESVDVLIEAVYEPHYQHFGSEFGKTFAGFFSDEPCFGNGLFDAAGGEPGFYDFVIGTPHMALPWRADLLDRLTAEMEEDALPLLPLLWFAGGEKTARLRIAYMDIITKLYRDCFSRKLGDWCRARGVAYIGHVIEDQNCHTRLGHGAGHYFRSLEGQDMAGIDVVLRQIMPGMSHYKHTAVAYGGGTDPAFFDYLLAKLGASLADIQPHMRGRVMCEIYGAYGWAEGVPTMKWLTDHMLVRGVNCFVPHAFTSAFPDPDCPPHFYARGHNPQFRDFGLLMRYTNAMCHLLSGGRRIVSAAILYHAEAEWSGEGFMYTQEPAKALYDSQMDYTILPADALLGDARVKAGRLAVGEAEFPCLVVPQAAVLPRRLLDRIDEFARQGLCVIFVGNAPQTAAEGGGYTPGAETAVCAAPDELPDLLREKGFADIQLAAPAPLLRVLHITRGESQIVMLFNEAMTPFNGRVCLTAGGRPYTGAALRLDLLAGTECAVEAEPGGMPVQLAPYESCVLVYGGGEAEQAQPENAFAVKSRIPLETFAITLRDGVDDPVLRPYRTEALLHDITGWEAQPEFTGIIRYETIFTAPAAGRCRLQLGDVGETAHVWLNGEFCGARICPPYWVDLSAAVRAGENRLVVEVANSLAYTVRDNFSRGMLLKASGLLGPVCVEFAEE